MGGLGSSVGPRGSGARGDTPKNWIKKCGIYDMIDEPRRNHGRALVQLKVLVKRGHLLLAGAFFFLNPKPH